MVPLGEAHVRQLVHEFVEHYHHERNHQGRRQPNSGSDRHRRSTRTPTLSGGSASADFAASTTERPHEGAAEYLHLTRCQKFVRPIKLIEADGWRKMTTNGSHRPSAAWQAPSCG